MATLIDDATALDELLEPLASAPLVAIDTEFVRERTYFPQLCLVQVATGDMAACVDCIATGIDLRAFFDVLMGDTRTWVLHSGRQDLEVIRQAAGRLPARIIDTQIAAALLGRSAQAGLREVLAEVLGVDIGKAFTRTDWSRRPLPEGAIDYALDDVRHLLPLWQRLEAELAAQGRIDWVHEDSERLLRSAEHDDLLPIWARLKGVQSLGEAEQHAAFALIAWRERVAAAANRPRRWILADDLVLRIAVTRPASIDELAALPDLPKKLADRHGAEIIARVTSPPHAPELDRHAGLERPDKDAVKALQVFVRRRAEALGIEPEVLASRKDLIAWLAGSPPPHLTAGWRTEALGDLNAALRS